MHVKEEILLLKSDSADLEPESDHVILERTRENLGKKKKSHDSLCLWSLLPLSTSPEILLELQPVFPEF